MLHSRMESRFPCLQKLQFEPAWSWCNEVTVLSKSRTYALCCMLRVMLNVPHNSSYACRDRHLNLAGTSGCTFVPTEPCFVVCDLAFVFHGGPIHNLVNFSHFLHSCTAIEEKACSMSQFKTWVPANVVEVVSRKSCLRAAHTMYSI